MIFHKKNPPFRLRGSAMLYDNKYLFVMSNKEKIHLAPGTTGACLCGYQIHLWYGQVVEYETMPDVKTMCKTCLLEASERKEAG